MRHLHPAHQERRSRSPSPTTCASTSSAPELPEWLDTDSYTLFANPSGRFELGGPQADTGLTGRKIIVDTYGGWARHGGGAFSGKDPSKVDRSGAYAARWVAKHVVASGAATRCEIQVAYAIGVAHPVSVMIDTFGTETVAPEHISKAVDELFDLRPAAIVRDLDLRRPIYRRVAAYGHFGRSAAEVPWEATPRLEDLRARPRPLGLSREPGRSAGSRSRRGRCRLSDPEARHGGGAVVEVLPDVSGIDRAFAYEVPAELAGIIRSGCIVRVVLNGRRVRGWVVAEAGELPPGIELRQVSELVSLGPPPEVVELARWASWRYAGRLRPLLMAASPPRLVRSLPAAPSVATPSLPACPAMVRGAGTALGEEIAAVTAEALSFPVAVLRLPPAAPRLVVVEAAIAARGKSAGTCSSWQRRDTTPSPWRAASKVPGTPLPSSPRPGRGRPQAAASSSARARPPWHPSVS